MVRFLDTGTAMLTLCCSMVGGGWEIEGREVDGGFAAELVL